MLGKFLIYLFGRIIKVMANIIKLLCYPFHYLFPKKRFTLPVHAKPLFKSHKHTNIPKTLWQTNFTNKVTLPVYINYLFNRLMACTYDYRFMITEDRAGFIKTNYSSEIFENYSKIQIGAAQADFWRLLVLHNKGGVYLDIDAHFIWPPGSIIKPDDNELYLTTKDGGISNHFFASKKDNPHLAKMIDIVMVNINENTLKNVYDLTGPAILNQVLENMDVNTKNYRYICYQGNFTNEFFQYIDKPEGKWCEAQKKIDIIKK